MLEVMTESFPIQLQLVPCVRLKEYAGTRYDR